jgi:hypothetical protein
MGPKSPFQPRCPLPTARPSVTHARLARQMQPTRGPRGAEPKRLYPFPYPLTTWTIPSVLPLRPHCLWATHVSTVISARTQQKAPGFARSTTCDSSSRAQQSHHPCEIR